ncbi:MAG: carboxymuconolactone decarboxylase family protein [Candidatus Binataceae bacterium]
MPTHKTLGAGVGLTAEQMANIGEWRCYPGFGTLDRLVLEYAEAMEHGVSVSDDLYRRMRAEFSEKEMVEIATTAGLCHLVNRFHGTFGTELESRPGDFTTASVKR